jgi:lipoprotein-releasing system ATP-binding protein
MNNILEAKHISKNFHDTGGMQVLNDINFSIIKGDFVSIIGKSGCGKSTLLYVLSTMDTDYQGEVIIDNVSMRNKQKKELAVVRNEKIGFVFQFHYLLNEFSVLENVMLPAYKLNKFSRPEIQQHASQKLEMLDILKLSDRKVNQLSGGEKQRVAIARALINNPLIIMADEPTGNLDTVNSEIVFNIFQQLSKEYNQTILVVTHDPGFAKKTHRIIEMADGSII